MPFSDFHGNRAVVDHLRAMIARHKLPPAVVLSGYQGCGKYTLALMLAQTLNCLNPTSSGGLPEFCGVCANCVRIAQSRDLDARVAEAIEARENLREVDKKETRIFVQTHPDVLIIPPDPPQMMIKMDQVRRVIETIYFRPGAGKERIYIFTASSFMKEAANSLLKVLEEPPECATIFLLAENPGELLPTIRSRCMSVSLCPLSMQEVQQYLAQQRPEWNVKQRALVARLCEGAIGRAHSFDLGAYEAARSHAMSILNSAVGRADHSELFRVTETYRAGGDSRVKFESLLRTLYSLLRDLLAMKSAVPEFIRNTDIELQLRKLADSIDLGWIATASDRLSEVERGMRRNLLRPLSLDAFATSLEP